MKRLLGIFLIFGIVCPSNLLTQGAPVTTRAEEIKGFTMTLADRGGREKAVINGSVANILSGGVGLIEILDVVVRVLNPDDREGDVLIHSSSGIYNRLKNVIDTDQFVRINGRDMVITGTGLHWEPDRARVEIYRNVRIEYTTHRGSGDSADVSSQPLVAGGNPVGEDVVTVITAEGCARMDYEDGIVAVLRKRVEVEDKDAGLKAHLMKLFFDSQTRALTRVEAYGNVRIKQPKRESSCRKAVYFVDEDKIVLSGAPRIVQGLDLYTAQEITIYNKGERVVFEPRAELVIYPGTEHEELL